MGWRAAAVELAAVAAWVAIWVLLAGLADRAAQGGP